MGAYESAASKLNAGQLCTCTMSDPKSKGWGATITGHFTELNHQKVGF